MQYNTYTDGLKTAVFDIETSGLSYQKDMIISASFCDENGDRLRQYFCDDPESEYLLITKILEEFENLDAVITYNGERFDIPFVFARANKYSIPSKDSGIWNIDIYRILKKYWKAGELLPSLSQASVEKALGIRDYRTDRIDGNECIPLYNRYLAGKDESAKEKILLHNADDVRQLAKITSNLSFIPFQQVAYDNGYSFKVKTASESLDDIRFKLGPVYETVDRFTANFKTVKGMLPLSVFEEYFSLEYDSFSGIGRVVLFPKELEDYIYIDLKEAPVDISDYEDLDGYASGYLILKQAGEIKYKELNRLIKDLASKTVYE